MNTRTHTALLGLIIVWAALSGCRRESPLDGPPQLRLGRDECIECGMIISEDRFSAASIAGIDGQEQHLLFDDIGDMIDHERHHPDRAGRDRFVHDYTSRQWISAQSAVYLLSDGIKTPMGSGIAAFAQAAHAAEVQREAGGTVLNWDELVAARNSRAAAGGR